MLIIGSVALNKLVDTPLRTPRDLDVIAAPEELFTICESLGPLEDTRFYPSGKIVFFPEDGPITEVEVAEPGSTAAELLEQYSGFAPANVLLALKLSHRYLRNSPAFYKTMEDVRTLRKLGASVKGLESWISRREKETYWYKHPSLKQNKDEFFGEDANRYAYDHDEIHECVAFGERPAYLEYKDPNHEVNCLRELFEACDEQVRLNGVAEEAMVLAYERSIIPFGTHPRDAFLKALMKVCSSITSGWFREYAWENHDKVARMFTPSKHEANVDKLRQLTPVHEDAQNTLR